MRLARIAIACAALAVASAGFADFARAGQKDVESRLACQCGCGLTVLTCNHLQCGFAIPVREEIARKLEAGISDDEIVAAFVEEYGEKVLSSPTHTGFNLLAWYVPYVVAFAGGVVILLVMRRWTRTAPADPSESEPTASRAGREELERELKELDS